MGTSASTLRPPQITSTSLKVCPRRTNAKAFGEEKGQLLRAETANEQLPQNFHVLGEAFSCSIWFHIKRRVSQVPWHEQHFVPDKQMYLLYVHRNRV